MRISELLDYARKNGISTAQLEQAFDDQCTGANPRYPLMSEIKEIYLKCYYGK